MSAVEVDSGREMHAYAQAIASQLNESSTVQKLYKKHGIEPPSTENDPATKTYKPSEFEKLYDGSVDSGGRHLRDQLRASVDMEAQKEIGEPGQQFSAGRPDIEPNSKLRPMKARGLRGRPGEFEELYRQEPIAFKSLNELKFILQESSFVLQPPEARSGISQAEWENFVERADQSVKNIKGGWGRFLENAYSTAQFGFSTFEIIWQGVDDEGSPAANAFTRPHKIEFRDQSTVDEWLLGERESELVGSLHQPHRGERYTLPDKGAAPAGRRLLHIAVNNRGNNFEGTSFLRPAVTFIKLKQLVLQLFGVSYQKYGSPLAFAKPDHEWADRDKEGKPADTQDLEDLRQEMEHAVAQKGLSVRLPTGATVEFAVPASKMPDPTPMLEYLDRMISMCFGNEGSLLGQGEVGSNAQAKTSDQKFLRIVPYVGSKIASALSEKVIRPMARWHFGRRLEAYPKYEFFRPGEESEVALGKIREFLSPAKKRKLEDYPKPIRKVVLRQLGLPENAFEQEQDRPDDGVGKKSVAQSIENIEPVKLYEDPSPDWPAVELQDDETDVPDELDIDVERAERRLDAAENKLARALKKVHSDHLRAFREKVRGITNPDRIEQIERRIREQFLPKYKAKMREILEETADKAARDFLRDQGKTVAEDAEMPEVDDKAMEALIASRAEEAYNRSQGHFRDQYIENLRGNQNDGIHSLEKSTFRQIGSRASSTAFNQGRQEVVEQAQDLVEQGRVPPGGDDAPGQPAGTPDKPDIKATRVAVMDSNTCSRCAALNGTSAKVGTKKYQNLRPPNHCLGGGRCRCHMEFEATVEIDPALDFIARTGV